MAVFWLSTIKFVPGSLANSPMNVFDSIRWLPLQEMSWVGALE